MGSACATALVRRTAATPMINCVLAERFIDPSCVGSSQWQYRGLSSGKVNAVLDDRKGLGPHCCTRREPGGEHAPDASCGGDRGVDGAGATDSFPSRHPDTPTRRMDLFQMDR